MKFDIKYQSSRPLKDQIHFNGSTYTPIYNSQPCFICSQSTIWRDLNINQSICSEECSQTVWNQIRENHIKELTNNHFVLHKEEIVRELSFTSSAKDATKDILIVVRNQLPYLKTCIQSIVEHTQNYKIYIWDNASDEEMQQYLDQLQYELGDRFEWCRSIRNMGFNEPNNQLASFGSGDYIILLNSDTKVHKGWSEAMLGYLQNNNNTKIVGYLGGLLDADGMGGRAAFGSKIDYVCGWCLCLSRETYKEFGLFNRQLRFAYCEDSDLSLRLIEAGFDIYALHLLLVHHFENKTINEVKDEGEVDVRETFAANHEYMRLRWADYLKNHRIDVKEDKNEFQSKPW